MEWSITTIAVLVLYNVSSLVPRPLSIFPKGVWARDYNVSWLESTSYSIRRAVVRLAPHSSRQQQSAQVGRGLGTKLSCNLIGSIELFLFILASYPGSSLQKNGEPGYEASLFAIDMCWAVRPLFNSL